MDSSSSKEHTLAAEAYQPSLNKVYNDAFCGLIRKMGHMLPNNRVEIIKKELIRVTAENKNDDYEALKYAASLSVLIDLSLQGWIMDVKDDSLTLKILNTACMVNSTSNEGSCRNRKQFGVANKSKPNY